MTETIEKRINIYPDDWVITQRLARGRTITIYKGHNPYTGDIFVNTRLGTIWIKPTPKFEFGANLKLILNGVNFGIPHKVTHNRTARWKIKNKRLVEMAVKVNPPVPPKKSKRNIESIEYAEIMHQAVALPSKWKNDSFWISRIEIEGVPEGKELLIEVNRAESYDDVFRGWKPVIFNIEGTTRYLEIKSLTAVDWFRLKIRFRIDDHECTKSQVFKIERPKSERPSTPDWWESRAVRKPPEKMSPSFDNSHYEHVPSFYTDDVNVDYHYKGSTPKQVKVISAPGGFGVCWKWSDGETPVPRDWSRGNWFNDPVRACGVRIWYRHTRLRGSGAPWRASADTKHLDPRADNIIVIPVNQNSANAGDLVDVMVQGTTLHTKHLPPSRIETVRVGKYPIMLNPGQKFSMSVEVFRLFPAVKPITPVQYSELETNVDEPTQYEMTAVANQKKEIQLKMEIMEKGLQVSNAAMRKICNRTLPGFRFESDNFGLFNALPEAVWEEIIELTDTEQLNYDYTWTTCADFAGDFKAAAGRLGAKALIVWDKGGSHAYNALPVLLDGGIVQLKFFEPQTDGFPEIRVKAGQYSQDKGGLILAW